MCSVQESEVPVDVIKFDKLFIIATLDSLISFQQKRNLGQFLQT